MIIYRYRQETLGIILSYDILIQIVLDFLGFGYCLLIIFAGFSLSVRAIAISRSHLIGLNGTILTDAAIQSSYQELDLTLRASTEITCLSCHSYLLLLTSHLLFLLQHLVNHAILLGFLSGHPIVAVRIVPHLIIGRMRMF